ncbi:hypothetical protein EDD18DRAFT_1351773 [Armillaria luteobubalina]|uniref:Cytochrome P450 n=1 Tax=Armillaria luteobubalina TaxID=153913 RepID=A0AA39QA67_9AGAR|nr:hypothetical protein EDD18DRAFT_1351773 [Armillaria luteobubalina]
MNPSSVLMDLSLLDIAAFIVLVYTLNKLLLPKPKYHLPPGPKGLPIIGNIYNIPRKFEWVTYRELSRHYGSGIITLNLMGAPVIVINCYGYQTYIINQHLPTITALTIA